MRMKITVSLLESIFHSAERLAARLGLSRSELHRRAFDTLLLSDRPTVTLQLDAVHGVDGNQLGLDPELAVLQSQSIRNWAGR